MASPSVLSGAGDDQSYTIDTRKLDPLLRCCICKCYWRHPRTLKDCLHTFCKPCLYDWFRERGGMCPEPGCNTAFRLVEGLSRGGDVHKDTQKRDFLRQYMVALKYFPADWHEPDSPAESDDPDVKVVGPGHGVRKKGKKQGQLEEAPAGAGPGRLGPAAAGAGSSRASPTQARAPAAGAPSSRSGSGKGGKGKGKPSSASLIVLSSSESSEASGADSEAENGAREEAGGAGGAQSGAVSGRKRKVGSLNDSTAPAAADGSSFAAPRAKRARSGQASEDGSATASAAPANSAGTSAKAGSRGDRPTSSSSAGSGAGSGTGSAPEGARSQQTPVPRGAADGVKAASPIAPALPAGPPGAAATLGSTRRGTLLAVAPVPAIGVPNLHLTQTDRLRPVKRAEDAGESWLVRLQPYCRMLRKAMAARRPDLASEYDLAFSLHPDPAVVGGRIDAGEEGARVGQLLARYGARGLTAPAPAAGAADTVGAAPAAPGLYFTPPQVAAYFEAAVASGAWAAADAAVAEAEARLAARGAANVARSSGKPEGAPPGAHTIPPVFPPARSCPVPSDPAAAPAARPAGAVWPRIDWIPLDADGVVIPDAELSTRGPAAAAAAPSAVREWMPQLRLYYRLVPKAPAAAAVSDGPAPRGGKGGASGARPAVSGSRSAGESGGHKGH
jgi:hypothetical protein